MKQRIRLLKDGTKEEVINKAIEEEARSGWTVKQIIPIAKSTGFTCDFFLLLESPDDEEK